MTKIIFECSGGMPYDNVDLTLNLETLPDDEAQNLLQLIREANFFNLPSSLIEQPDQEQPHYVITVDVGIIYHTVHVTQNTTPLTLKPLLDELSTRTDVKPVG